MLLKGIVGSRSFPPYFSGPNQEAKGSTILPCTVRQGTLPHSSLKSNGANQAWIRSSKTCPIEAGYLRCLFQIWRSGQHTSEGKKTFWPKC